MEKKTYFHSTLEIAWNLFLTVKPLNITTAVTKS